MKKVGLIGLGIMGTGMAGQWLQKGYPLTVWNRDISKTAPLAEKGAIVAASPAELVAQVDVVVTMLRDDAAVRETLLSSPEVLGAARPGTIFVDMSTVTPMLATELAKAVQTHGLTSLEAPVLGSKEAAANALLTVIVGGEADVLEQVRDVLAAVSQTILHVGTYGSAAVFKLANNQAAAIALTALGESLKLCKAYDLQVSREQLLDSVSGTVSRVLAMKKGKILTQDWSTHFALELMHKDLTQALQTAEEKHLALPVVASARQTFERAIQAGKGPLDFSAVTDFE